MLPDAPQQDQSVANALKMLAWVGNSPSRMALVLIGAPVLFFGIEWLKLWSQGSLNSWSQFKGYAALALAVLAFFVAFAVVVVAKARRSRR